MNKDDFLDRHERLDEIYTEVYVRTILPIRRVISNIRVEREGRNFRPGCFYLDHGSHPCVLIRREHDVLTGVSMVHGGIIGGCSVMACGPELTTEDEARRLADIAKAKTRKEDNRGL